MCVVRGNLAPICGLTLDVCVQYHSAMGACGSTASQTVVEPDAANSSSKNTNMQAQSTVKIVFVLGGPGSGKGTQCEKIAANYGYSHLSTGDLLRAEAKKDTDRAKQVQAMMASGGLVPIEVMLDILGDAVSEIISTNGDAKLLLDGFPREMSQVDAFKAKFERDCTFALYFEVSPETMTERCLKRGQTSGRADDNAESLKQRVETYFAKSKPVVEHYSSAGLLKTVDAAQTIDQVYHQVQAIFDA
eukprot:m.89102 g.89102  ORF g.89102 m.89102 type:complete len:246 (-) comp12880_c0_seq1:211-948(-)